MFTVKSSADPPGARTGLPGSPVIETVTPLSLAFAERDPDCELGPAVGTTVAADVAAGPPADAEIAFPDGAAVLAAEQPTTAVTAQTRPNAAAASRYDTESLPCQNH